MKNGSYKIPAWIQSFECRAGRFRIPYWAVLAVFLGMLSWSLFYDLNRVDMNVWDESLFAIRAYQLHENGSFLQNFNQFAGLYDHPSTKLPLVTIIQVGSFYLWGPTVWALRFPIGIIALVGTLLSARILFRMGIGSKVGLLMGLFLVGSSRFLGEHMLRTGDHDAPLAFFLLLSGLYFFEYIILERKASIWGLGFWFLCALLTKNILAGVVVPAWIFFAFFWGNRRSLFSDIRLYLMAFGVLGVFAITLGGFEWAYPGFFNRMWNYELMGRYTEVIEGHTGPWYYYIALMFQEDLGFAVLVLVASALGFSGARWNTLTGKLAGFIAVMVLVYGVVISYSKTKLPWYDAPTFPMLALIAALGVSGFFRGGVKGSRMSGLEGSMKWGLVLLGLVLWFTNGTKVQARNTMLGSQGYLTLFAHLNEQNRLEPVNIIVEDDFGSDTYFYVKSFERQAHSARFFFTRDIVSLNMGDAVMVVKPWILSRVQAEYETETLVVLENAYYIKIKRRRDRLPPRAIMPK